MWSRSPDVAFVDDGDRVVVLGLGEPSVSRPSLLSAEAADVWRRLERPLTAREVHRPLDGHIDPLGLGHLLEALEQLGFVRCD